MASAKSLSRNGLDVHEEQRWPEDGFFLFFFFYQIKKESSEVFLKGVFSQMI